MTNIKALFTKKYERILIWVMLIFSFVVYFSMNLYVERPHRIDEFDLMLLAVSAALTALLPVIAYKIAEHLQVGSYRRKLAAAFVCGFSPAIIIHTNPTVAYNNFGAYAHNALTFLFPFLMVLIILSAADTPAKRTVSRGFKAILLAVTIAAAVFAHKPMICVAAAAVLALVLAKLVLKREPVPLKVFLIALLILGGLVLVLGVPGGYILGASRIFSFDFGGEFWRILSGRLYYVAVSTWGLGIVGVCLFLRKTHAYVVQMKSDTAQSAEESAKHAKFLTFSAFAFSALLFSIAYSVVESAYDLVYTQSQGYYIQGLFMENAIPLVLLAAVCGIFIYTLELRTILSATVSLGLIFTAFFVFTAGEVVNGENTQVAAIQGILPLRIGEAANAPITFDSLFMNVSIVFSVMALLIVFVSCGGRQRTRIVAALIAAITLYGTVYSAAVCLPYERLQINRLHDSDTAV
ncbi:MAG: hypothetical protein FWG45_02830 [Oscillospiraceae bacterium]|nr:hypothetical protein [Oscillospiraceae bacterium]